MFKTATLALAAIVASATIASAETTSNISNFVMEQDGSGDRVELGTVTASGDGVVEVYTFHKAEVGALVGSKMVKAGSNLDVDINFNRINTDAIAVLKVGGVIVDTQEISFDTSK
jgi:hypothetical protein